MPTRTQPVRDRFGPLGRLLRLAPAGPPRSKGRRGGYVRLQLEELKARLALSAGATSYVNGYPTYYLDSSGNLYSQSPAGVSLVDTNVQSYSVTNGGATLNVWETPPPNTPSQALTATSFIRQQDIDLIRTQPSQFLAVYQKYAIQFKARLGAAFHALTAEGEIAAFACVAAFQLAPSRVAGDPSPPPSGITLSQLLAAPRLVCNEYCELATLLFREACPQATSDGLKIYQAGWNGWVDTPSPVANHAQLFVTGVGVPLLLDPTAGVIARADLPTIESGTAVPSAWIVRPSTRIEYDAYVPNREPAFYTGAYGYFLLPPGSSARGSTSYLVWLVNSFAMDVVRAIEGGFYSAANLYYFIDTEAWTSLSGGGTASAAVGCVGHTLYVFGPGVPATYVDRNSGAWVTLPSGMAWFSVGFTVSSTGAPIPQYFNVGGADGSIWSIDLQMNAWQPGPYQPSS